MALQVPVQPSSSLFKEGYKHFVGVEEAIIRNINAVSELVQILSTSYGPNGKNKLIVNHLSKHFVTSDAHTILKELEVNHPAAKLLTEASSAQFFEIGDLSNYLAIITAQSLNFCVKWLNEGYAPSTLATAFELVKEELLTKLQDLRIEGDVFDAVRTSLTAKQAGLEDHLTTLLQNALIKLPKFEMDQLRVVKIMGGSTYDSMTISGMVFNRRPLGSVHTVEAGKVMILTCPLDIPQPETKGTVLFHNAQELKDYSRLEEDQFYDELKQIADAGVNCIIAGGNVHELAVDFCDRLGILVLKCTSKFELRRLCRVCNCAAMTRIGVPLKEEIGQAKVSTLELGSDSCCVFENEDAKTMTILLRGGTQPFLDDLESALMQAARLYEKQNGFCYGGGCTEVQLAKHLRAVKGDYADDLVFELVADALEMVPKIIAENNGLKGDDILVQLQEKDGYCVDIEGGVKTPEGILDSYEGKYWALTYAMNLCSTILKIDQIVMSKPAGGPKPPKKQGHWDDE